MSEDYTEVDFGDFGYRELSEVATLLEKFSSGNHHSFAEVPIKIGFNKSSGYVFIIDEDNNTYMMNGDELEQYYNCGNCGKEGFLEEFKIYETNCKECTDYIPIKYLNEVLERKYADITHNAYEDQYKRKGSN